MYLSILKYVPLSLHIIIQQQKNIKITVNWTFETKRRFWSNIYIINWFMYIIKQITCMNAVYGMMYTLSKSSSINNGCSIK